MGVSKEAGRADVAFTRRFKKLTPGARFKSMTKGDQYVVTARTLSDQLVVLRDTIGREQNGALANGTQVTIREIHIKYVEIDPGTGLLTRSSASRIKRAVANALKSVLGKDAMFMFTIEQQDKEGNPCSPHVHALINAPFRGEVSKKLKIKLHKFAGSDKDGTVEIQTMFRWRKRRNELSPADADYRRVAQYAAKNDQTVFYRSKTLMEHVHARFEELKKHHGITK